jgi:hypothetical protein
MSWGATVVVGDHAGDGAASGQRGHLEGMLDELGSHVLRHGVAHDPAAAQIHDVGQIEPAPARRDRGAVATGALAGLADADVPLHQVG